MVHLDNQSPKPLLSDYKNLLKTFPNNQVFFFFFFLRGTSNQVDRTYRAANQCANALGRPNVSITSTFDVFDNPPHVVEDLIALDKEGRTNRLTAA